MAEMTPLEKGNVLEAAVFAIESAILRDSPSFKDGNFQIDGKKIVIVSGVRHEIDIYVIAKLAAGYEAVFIFECKNWESPISKDEIVAFTEKIKITNAQRGFFVAKSFSSYATAQAKLDPRILLLTAADFDASAMPPFCFFVYHDNRSPHYDIVINRYDHNLDKRPFGVEGAVIMIDGQTVDLATYVANWGGDVREQRVRRYMEAETEKLGAGAHALPFSDTREFDRGKVSFNGQSVRSIDITGEVTVELSRATITSAIDVVTRGRVRTYRMGNREVQVKAELIERPSQIKG